MSDQPLFQNTDEQERVYAPQETADPEAREAALVEEGTLSENRAAGGTNDDAFLSTDDTGGVAPIPGPGATGALNPMGNVSSSGSGSPLGRADAEDEDDSGR